MYINRTKGEEGLVETYKSVQGGGGSKIAKFERTYYLNDPLAKFPLQKTTFETCVKTVNSAMESTHFP